MTKQDELRLRTKQFALRVIKLFRALPKADDARTIGRQVLRSATSVAANYRAVCQARSRAEFIAKVGIVLEEADESLFWLEILAESGIVPAPRLSPLANEAEELVSIFAAIRRTARKNAPVYAGRNITKS